jgi:type I restriction enzyme S subunit
MKTEIPEGYKNSPVGIIPEEWEVKLLEDIADITSGGTPSRKIADNWNGNIPWVTTSLLNKSKIQSTEEHITQNGLNNSATKILPTNTVLMAMYGQGQTRGKVSILRIEAATNQACAAIVVNKSARYDYIFYQLSNMYDIIRNLSNDGSQKNLNLQLIKNIYVTLPPLPEQQKIAEILSMWDVAIEKQTLLIEKLEHRKRALMQQLLTGKKRLSGFEGEWKKVKLGEIGEISSAGVDKTLNINETPVRLLNYLDVYRRDFLFDSELNYWVTAKKEKIESCSVKKGDVFFTPSSEVPNDIGNSAVAMEDISNTVYSYHIVRLRIIDDWDLKFRAYAFKTDYFYRQAEKFCDGSGQRYVISLTNFRNISVVVPLKNEEQSAIAAILSTADQEIHIAKEKLEQLKKQKKGLMQLLLTGKKRVITTTNTQTNENIRNQKSI